MKKLTPYKVTASLVLEKLYSKIFYIDESIYMDQDEIDEAIFDMASDSWNNQGEEWQIFFYHNIDGVDFCEIEKL